MGASAAPSHTLQTRRAPFWVLENFREPYCHIPYISIYTIYDISNTYPLIYSIYCTYPASVGDDRGFFDLEDIYGTNPAPFPGSHLPRR